MTAFFEMFEKIFAYFGIKDAEAVLASIKEFFEKIFAPKVEE